MASQRTPHNRDVAILVYDGLCAFEFGCAAEVFGLPRPEFEPGWYRFKTCAATSEPLRSQYGLSIVADRGLDHLVRADIVVVPGWHHPDLPAPAPILDALRQAHANGARLLSICSGAFVLAATGLLDGQRIATHWRYAERMRERYPQIECDPNVLFVDTGRIVTSAGSAAGLDACLHIVRCDHGAAVANQVAKRLVVPAQRDGGQAQFVERPTRERERHSLSPLLDRMLRHIDKDLSIYQLAGMASMSERTFLRRFRQATGATPAQWLISARVDRARELLETSAMSLETVAERCGLGSAITLRRHFRERLGVTPTAYRQHFFRDGARERGRAKGKPRFRGA